MMCLFYVIRITVQSKKTTFSRVLHLRNLGRDLQSAELNQTTKTVSRYEYKYQNKVFPLSLHFDFPSENMTPPLLVLSIRTTSFHQYYYIYPKI